MKRFLAKILPHIIIYKITIYDKNTGKDVAYEYHLFYKRAYKIFESLRSKYGIEFNVVLSPEDLFIWG